jgi:hypothetical protein
MGSMTYGYQLGRLAPDYARATLGFAATAVPTVVFSLGTVPRMIMIGLGALFLGYGIQTALRHRTHFTITDQDISAHPRGVRLRWGELTTVKLDYYAVRREAKNGWMQLTLKSGRKRLCLDSRLEGFAEIARRAAVSARDNGLALSPATVSNFSALHLDTSSS